MNRATRTALNPNDRDASLNERGMAEAVWTEQTVTSSTTLASVTVIAMIALSVLLYISFV